MNIILAVQVYDYIQESMIGKLKDNNLEATSSDLSALQHAFAGALAGAAATAVRSSSPAVLPCHPAVTLTTSVTSSLSLWHRAADPAYASDV